jgi:dihydroorotase
MIDPHVHCRDGKQAYKETIRHVFEIAERQGVKKIFDMPNTDPPILWERDVLARLKLVPPRRLEDYFLFIGATTDGKQIREAVRCWDEYAEVVGIKLYAGQSVGKLALITIEEQRAVYETLSHLGYRGVIAVHCESESHMKHGVWNPANPITHSLARPKLAETASVRAQIRLVTQANFKGTLHICHVSCPETVRLIHRARRKMKITAGVTPHHILWSNQMLRRPDGLLYKMNPPLRDEKDVAKLRRCLREGKIDWIETDHAPHAIGEKLFPPYLAGYPSLYLYGMLVNEFLPGMGLKRGLIKKLTCKNICRTFRIKVG